MSIPNKIEFKNFEQMIKHTRATGLKIRADMINYFCTLVSKRSAIYDYFYENNALKRINKKGIIDVCLKSKTKYILCGYLFELEKFIDLGLERKYKNLENFYKKHGFGKIVKVKNNSYKISTDLFVK